MTDPAPKSLSKKFRLGLYVITWCVALLVTIPSLEAIVFAPMFPAGLFYFAHKASSSGGADFIDLVLGWVAYFTHAVFYLLVGKRVWFWTFYALLVLLLLTNVAGCRSMPWGLSGIH